MPSAVMTSPSFSRGARPMTGSVVRGWFGVARIVPATSARASSAAPLRQRIPQGLGGEAVAPILVMPEVRVHVLPGCAHRLEARGPGRDGRVVVPLARTEPHVREVRGHTDRLDRARRALPLPVHERDVARA